MKIKELKVLNMTEPCGIGDSPYFSWIIESDRQDTVQTVYSLVVKSSNSVVWDTGKVECSKNSFIPYKGKMLKSRCRYSVQITIWDNYGNEASAETWFETALLHPYDWTAHDIWNLKHRSSNTLCNQASYFVLAVAGNCKSNHLTAASDSCSTCCKSGKPHGNSNCSGADRKC